MNLLKASRLWLYGWGAVALLLIAGAFLIPFRWWAVAAVVLFGTMEAIGLWWNGNGSRPPLTDVIRAYMPMQLCLPVIWALWAAAGVKWGVFHPESLALVPWMAVLGFFTGHFVWRYMGPKSDVHL